ncbi:MAG: alpha-E domain-containing protein [Verrucomicrobiota bacterium JB023]|nr:alpha-E domain-containing protein [Verrucomicrobiota bacterium JB023]
MLSRVAESMMWMGRYLERAEGLARVVEVSEQLALDVRHPELTNAEAFFLPIVKAYGMADELEGKSLGSEELIGFLMLDKENPGSVLSSLTLARQNARMVRDQLGSEFWEVLNDVYLWCRGLSKKGSAAVNAVEMGMRVRQACLHFRGLVDELLERGEIWCFLKLGMKLERADQTSRVLDLRTFMPSGTGDTARAFEPYVWLTIMRGCGAESQRGFGSTEPDWPRAVRTLVLSNTFPRSIRHCVGRINEVLHELSGTKTGVDSNEAELACGRLLAELDLLAYSGMVEGDIHDFLDGVQLGLIEIGKGIQDAYSYQDEIAENEDPAETPEASSQTQSQG